MSMPSNAPKSGSPLKIVLVAVGGLFLLGVGYVVAWPIVPSIEASKIDNPMGEDFAMAFAHRSLLAKTVSSVPSASALCDAANAASTAMGEAGECNGDATFTRGSIKEDGEEAKEYLWAEIRNVKHGDETETACFYSTNEGRDWSLGSGLSLFGMFPIQYASGSCRVLRAGRYAVDDDVTYREEPLP